MEDPFYHGGYRQRFEDLAGDSRQAAYSASDLIYEIEGLQREAATEGQVILDREAIGQLCQKLAAFVEDVDAYQITAESIGRSEEDILEALEEAEAISMGSYEHGQDRQMALAAALIGLLNNSRSQASKQLAWDIVGNFLESYGEPAPLVIGEMDNGHVRLLATDAGLLPAPEVPENI